MTVSGAMHAGTKGLSSREALGRLKETGENVIYRKKRLRPLVAFIKKFNSPLLLLLIFASLVSLFLGATTSAFIILVMVVVSAVLDFLNSYKSEKVAEKLIARVAATATVLRDGVKREVLFAHIVPGDVLYLSAGDVIPADAEVLLADDFFVNQSALTGESFPVEKQPAAAGGENGHASKDHSAVFMGTSVVAGFATVRADKTGQNAEFGKIAERLASAETETDFERGIKHFSVFVMRLSAVMVAFVFLANAFLGRGVLASFIFAVAIAVGLTPELLPVIMSVSLSRGSLVMSKKDVVVKNLSAIQNFGGMNVFCTDKTGTLTEDHITLMKCVDRFGVASEEVLRYAYLSSVFHTARKNPLDTAIREHRKVDITGYRKIDEIPFDFSRKRDSIAVEHKSERLLVTKGAPEDVLRVCEFLQEGARIISFDDAAKSSAGKEFDALSADGFRVLGIATKRLKTDGRTAYRNTEEAGMTFLGFAAFLDPPKKTVSKTIQELHALNVEIKIITGDSEILTERICRDIHLEIKGVMTGSEVATMPDAELEKRVGATTVFARVTPEEKERIILALRRTGQVVGYLGDGINDAPALKAADVGISVANAVDVAKETADIILLAKSLHVLKDGIIEGRKTFQNTIKYIKMGLSSNFGNMFSMVGVSAFLPFLPMLPPQILFNNFLYDISQTMLPTDTVDADDTKNPPRWDLGNLKRYMLVFGIVSSLFDFATFAVLFSVFHLSAAAFQTGWFIESIATQVLVVHVIRTRRMPFFKSRPSILLFASTALVVIAAWLVPGLGVGKLLGFSVLPLGVRMAIVGIIAAYLVVAEMVKRAFYRRYANAL